LAKSRLLMMDEISTLHFIAANPGKLMPRASRRAVTRLLRFQLIRRKALGFVLRSGGVETVVRDEPTPQCVRDVIERAREAHRKQ
jgi:hypothetical protein